MYIHIYIYIHTYIRLRQRASARLCVAYVVTDVVACVLPECLVPSGSFIGVLCDTTICGILLAYLHATCLRCARQSPDSSGKAYSNTGKSRESMK